MVIVYQKSLLAVKEIFLDSFLSADRIKSSTFNGIHAFTHVLMKEWGVTMELAYFILSVISLIVVAFLFYGKYLFKRKKDTNKP